jgi:hypothetical protein
LAMEVGKPARATEGGESAGEGAAAEIDEEHIPELGRAGVAVDRPREGLGRLTDSRAGGETNGTATARVRWCPKDRP